MSSFYLDLHTTDPAYNLAVEQVLFDRLSRGSTCFMLWQNDNAVVIGRYQNAWAEVDPQALEAFGTRLVRRKSGGGAVFHDLGNLNYSLITDAPRPDQLNIRVFCLPVLEILRSLGVNAELNGRNDMVIDGLKFSGNAEYAESGRLLHHGTLLFDSALDRIPVLLRPDSDKLRGKGIPSVRSRVTNLREHLPEDLSLERFRAVLLDRAARANGAVPWSFSVEDLQKIEALRRDRYDAPSWNWGSPPPCMLHRKRRIAGCGTVELCMDIENGYIRDLRFQGDFFSARDPAELAARFLGKRAEAETFRKGVDGVDLSCYFAGMTREQFLLLIP